MSSDTASRLIRHAPTEVELEIPLSSEEIAAAEDRAFARLVRKAKLPGFRPGKVPRRLFEQTYGAETIRSEALEDVAPLAYARALKEHDLEALDRPTIELLPDEEGKPSRLRARVEVRPPIELGEYKGVRVTVPAVHVQEEDVERALQTFAREHATLVPVDRAAKVGDVVTIDYEGRMDGELFDGGSAKRQQTELLEERFIPGFAAGIAGMTVGERREFDATFPVDYPKSDYAGKSVRFAVTLHEVKEIDVPGLDDELAKSATEYETIDALREEMRRRLEALANGRRRRVIANTVMQQLLTRIDVPVPQGLIDREVESMLAETAEQSKAGGMNEDELRPRLREEASTRVKGTLLLEAIGRAEGLEASPADVRAEIEALARSYGQPPERMREALGRNLRPLKEGIVRTKALDVLVDNAQVEDAAEEGSTKV